MAISLVIFGASGDLTSRKLIPALFQLFRKQRLPEGTQIVGFSRTPFSDDQWRRALTDSTEKFSGGHFDRAAWDKFAARDPLSCRRHLASRRFRRPAATAERAGGLARRDARLLPGHGAAILRRDRGPAGGLRTGRRGAWTAADRDRKTVWQRWPNRPPSE